MCIDKLESDGFVFDNTIFKVKIQNVNYVATTSNNYLTNMEIVLIIWLDIGGSFFQKLAIRYFTTKTKNKTMETVDIHAM